MLDRIGRTEENLMESALRYGQMSQDPHRVIAAKWPGLNKRGVLHRLQESNALVGKAERRTNGVHRFHCATSLIWNSCRAKLVFPSSLPISVPPNSFLITKEAFTSDGAVRLHM